MTKPFIYVMPQAFVEDEDVPARWRVWAYINGFFVNNQTCWASNETIGEKISAHKDTVSKAVSELEGLELISCERTRRTRLISPRIRREIGVHAYQDPSSTPISDRRGRLSISDSNSDNIVLEKEVSEESQRTTYAQTRGYATNRVKPILKKGEEISGIRFPNVRAQETNISKCLQFGYTEDQIIEKFEELLSDLFWGSKGVDFGTVLSQIGKAKKKEEPIMSFGKKK